MTSKSAMTPSFIGRIATMLPGVRPSISLASLPTARTFLGPLRRRLHGDHARLVRDDAATLDERERRGRPEIDGQVVGKHSVDPIEEHVAWNARVALERRKVLGTWRN